MNSNPPSEEIPRNGNNHQPRVSQNLQNEVRIDEGVEHDFKESKNSPTDVQFVVLRNGCHFENPGTPELKEKIKVASACYLKEKDVQPRKEHLQGPGVFE